MWKKNDIIHRKANSKQEVKCGMDDDELILLIGIGLAALLTLLITLIICL